MENLKYPGIFKDEKNITLGGITFDKCVSWHGSATDLFRFHMKPKNTSEFLSVKYNQKMFQEKVNENDWQRNQFAGGTFEEISKQKTDFSQLNKYQAELKKLSIWKKVTTTFQDMSIKKRVRSQYDGEFDFDKRWDLEPFQRRGVSSTSRKTVRLNISLAFSAYVETRTINNYGAFCAAIAVLLENAGLNVELNAFIAGRTTVNSYDLAVANIKIKRSDEYLPTQNILQIFNSNFYRRVGFGCWIAQADFVNKQACPVLGYPLESQKHWELKDGQVYIHSVKAMDRQEQCLADILGFIKTI